VTRRAVFSAARRLHSSALDDAASADLFGKEQALHGHDFTLQVTVQGAVPEATGMVMDLKALSGLLREEVTSKLDRSRLDGAPLLAGKPATSENLAAAIFAVLSERLAPGALVEVALGEGGGAGAGYGKTVRYRGEKGDTPWKS
jgi:6-pyruvoyltetrahydropterin/6-carboxytetrahydropterin synthase